MINLIAHGLFFIFKITVATLQAIPEGLDPPQLIKASPESLTLGWSKPAKPNGVITRYTISLHHDRNIENIDLPGTTEEHALTGT